MKIINILFILNIYILIFISNALAASTSVNPNFDASEYYQGKTGTVDVWVTNTGTEYILLEKIMVNFDWMQSGYSYGLDKTSTPIRIDAGSKVNIGKITFGIDASSSIGWHTYQWSINGQENKIDFWGKPYLSPFNINWFGSSQIYIETPLKPEADSALNSALNDINTARSKNFESIDAINKVNQATTDYNSGINAKSGRDFTTSINYANSAKKFITDSYPIEQTYQTNKANTISAKNDAISTINSVPSLQSVDAKNKLNEANSHLSIAETQFSSKNFNSAISEYNTAKSLAQQASNLESDYQAKQEADRITKQNAGISEAKAKQDADSKVAVLKQNADSTITIAKSKINNIADLKSEQAKNMLNDARSHLNTAENHFSTNNFDAAINEAKIAGDYADNALNTDEKWKSENPIQSAAKAPGFEYIYAISGIILVYILFSKK